MPPDSGNIAPNSAYVTAMNRITTAPITHAQTAPGPASRAGRHAPDSQPEPMIEPRPVNISAHAPTLRRIANSLLIRKTVPGKAADDRRSRGGCPCGDGHAAFEPLSLRERGITPPRTPRG